MASTQVDLIRERTDIVELIGQRVKLRQAGRSLKGLCPFHNEKTPSFVVYPESQHFHCFGCGKSGDAFSFVMAMDNLDFPDALRLLADRAGVELEARVERKDPERDKVRERLVELNERAAAFFSNALWNTDAGAPARALLEQRGVDRKTAERFGLGFAPDSFDALKRHFAAREVGVDELVQAGLLTTRDDGRSWDRFRNRVTFPIRDREGRTLGFGARALGDEKPKYLNTAETPIFDKRSLLYALDKAYDEIRKQRTLIIVEGYMDAIAAHQFGYTNVVATMGTAVTANQVSGIRRYVDRVYLALDADAAGQLAALRGIDALREGFGDEERPAVVARGVVRFERTLGAEIRIVQIPHGKDPDDLIRHNPHEWEHALEVATPLVEYYLTNMLSDVAPTPQARARALQDIAVPVLREIQDAAVLATYLGLTARLLGYKDTDVHAALLRGSVVPAKSTPTRTMPLQPDERPSARDPERYVFALALRYPLVARANLDRIDPHDLLDVRNQLILEALSADTFRETAFPDSLPAELQEYRRSLEDDLADRPSQTPGAANNEMIEAIQRLARARHEFRVRQVQADIQAARASNDTEQLLLNLQRMTDLAKAKSRFDPRESPYFRDTRSEAG
ncbi:MAG: DNA primase [Chloroflexi bacterium]|nr:MAG: DNA primase [Chloroflexota bacterium]